MEKAHTWREDKEVKTNLKENVYVRVFVFTSQDTIECVVESLGKIVVL
jgi:hypothetical protein